MMMRKVSVKKPVRMVLCTLMLMNVQKRRLNDQKRQHQVHQDGDATLHNAYSTFEFKARSRLPQPDATPIEGDDLLKFVGRSCYPHSEK